jgi:hypothetical protein
MIGAGGLLLAASPPPISNLAVPILVLWVGWKKVNN